MTAGVFCSDEATLVGLLGGKLVSEGLSHDEKLRIFSPTPPLILQRGERARHGMNGRLCLCDEVSLKIPQIRGSCSFGDGECVQGWGVAWLLSAVPMLRALHLSHLAVSKLYPFTMNGFSGEETGFLSSVSCSSKLNP